MRWGFVRLAIIGAAFLVGMMVAGYQNSAVLAPGPAVTDLPASNGTSLVVACDIGDPTVEHVNGISGAVEVKCYRSQMHVTKFGIPAPAIEGPGHTGPSTPVANNPKNAGKASS